MKIDVLLVQPDQGEFVRRRIFNPGVEIPLNVACLAAFLEREGISNRILDMRIYPSPYRLLEDVISEQRPRIVGISAFTSEAENARKVARLVKELNRNITTVIGGSHASALPEDLLKEEISLDLLVHGEGEITFAEITERVESGSDFCDVDGIAYRDGERIIVNPRRKLIESLEVLPFPARDQLEMDKYIPSPGTGNYMRLPTTGIMASRGCPYRCNYCSKGVWEDTIRFRSVENVLSEIEHCIEKYGIYDFRFYDDGLTLPQWDLKRFCELVIHRGLKITWNCYSRVNHIDKEKLIMMKEAGCYHIKFGIEFGTEKAIKLANKRVTLQQSKNAVQWTKEVGIECKGNFILGIPGETIEDCHQTVSFAIELSPDLATFYPFDLFPGSQFYKRKVEGDEWIDKRLPREVTQQLSNKAYRAFYFRGGYILQRLRRLFRNPRREIPLVMNGLWMIMKFYFLKGFRKDIEADPS